MGIDEGVDRLRVALAHASGVADPEEEGLDRLAERLLHEVGSTHRVDDVALLLTAYG